MDKLKADAAEDEAARRFEEAHPPAHGSQRVNPDEATTEYYNANTRRWGTRDAMRER